MRKRPTEGRRTPQPITLVVRDRYYADVPWHFWRALVLAPQLP